MNIPVILYGDDGTLLHGIESQRGAVSVARTTDDLAEALGFAQTGIARVLLCAVPVTDLTASMVATLAEAEVRVVIIADPRDKLPFGTYWVDSNAELADVLNTLEQASLGTILAVGEQPRPQLAASPDGYGYDAAYGYSIPQTQQAPLEAPEAPQPHNYTVEPIEEPTTVIGNTEPESAPQNPQTYVTYRAYRYDPEAEKAAREVTEVIASDDSSELLANDADNSGAEATNTEEKHTLTPQQQAAELNPEEAVLNEAAAILNGFDPTQPDTSCAETDSARQKADTTQSEKAESAEQQQQYPKPPYEANIDEQTGYLGQWEEQEQPGVPSPYEPQEYQDQPEPWGYESASDTGQFGQETSQGFAPYSGQAPQDSFGYTAPVDATGYAMPPQPSAEWHTVPAEQMPVLGNEGQGYQPPSYSQNSMYNQQNAQQPGISSANTIQPRRGTVLTVWGTAGAPGRSTLALNLASTAAADGLKVCLIDADTYNPSLSPLLGLLDEYSGISQMCHFADRASLTEQNAREALCSVALGKYSIDFLSGITRANRWPELRAKSLAASIDWLATRYDVLIIDVASCIEADEELSYDGPVPLRNGAAITALEKADRIVMLGNADVIGVPRLIQAYEQLRDGPYDISPLTRIDLWLCKVRSDASGHGTVGELRRAWERFGPSVGLTGFLPYDRKSLDKAWMRGQTLQECAPKSPLTRGINDLYRKLDIASGYKQPQVAVPASPSAHEPAPAPIRPPVVDTNQQQNPMPVYHGAPAQPEQDAASQPLQPEKSGGTLSRLFGGRKKKN